MSPEWTKDLGLIKDQELSSNCCNTSKMGQKLIQHLMDVGYSRQHITSSLCFTGFHSFRLASEWISSHIRDPLVKDYSEADFHVFLALGKEIQSNISEFTDELRTVIGWNVVSDYPPAIPITHLKVNCCDALHLYSIFVNTFSSLDFKLLPSDFEIVYSNNLNIISLKLIITNNSLTSFLQNLALSFLVKLTEAGLKARVADENLSTQQLVLIYLCELSTEQIQLVERLKNTYLSQNLFNQTIQLSFDLYVHDPRIVKPMPEIFYMTTYMETDVCELLDRTPMLNENHGNIRMTSDKVSDLRTTEDSLSIQTGEDLDQKHAVSTNTDTTTTTTAMDDSESHTQLILSHFIGDYVLLLGSGCLLDGRRMGCPVGLNLSTGLTGLFQISAGRRIPQYLAWTLYCSLQLTPICGNRSSSLSVKLCDKSTKTPLTKLTATLSCPILNLTNLFGSVSSASSSSATSSASSSKTFVCMQPDSIVNNKSSSSSLVVIPNSDPIHYRHQQHQLLNSSLINNKMQFDIKSLSIQHSQLLLQNLLGHPKQFYPTELFMNSRCKKNAKQVRQLFVMRHAERVDVCFGTTWLGYCFDKKGVYHRLNLNLPPCLPRRESYMEYVPDTPITEVGLFVASETGRALSQAGVQFTACYCSPAFRCVQTAAAVLHAMDHLDVKIRIEPHLFEWFGWYNNSSTYNMPKWMQPDELSKCGYPIDLDYSAYSSMNNVNFNETIPQYYDRNAAVIKHILTAHKSKSSCLLVVAHASSLDTCTRHLVHHRLKQSLTTEEFHQRTSGVPFCGFVVAQENRRWTLVNPPIPNICTYSRNSDFNWRQILK